MKKLLLSILVTAQVFIYAQESQSVRVEKWKNGVYEQYNNSSFIGTEWNKNDEKPTLTIKKNSKGKISKVSLTGKFSIGTFSHADSTVTEFVRHYMGEQYSSYKLYFNETSIVVYEINSLSPKPDIRLIYCIGAKPVPELKEEIVAYLEQTANYYVPYNISKSKDIESITAEVIYSDKELVSGTYIDIGYTVKTKWGIEIKSKNLGGKLEMKYFNVSVTQFQKYTSETTRSKYSWKVDCNKLTNKEIEVVVTLTYDSQGKYITNVPVICDSENSPVTKMNNVFKDYDQISYTTLKKGQITSATLKNVPESGYTSYPLELVEIFKKTNPETDLIKVVKNNKCGYIQKDGKVIIPLEYDGGAVNDFKNKIITVNKDGKWGFIDFQNKVVTDFIYDVAFKESYGVYSVGKDKKYGYVNATGKQFVNTIYDNAYDFSSYGFGTVVLSGKRGLIDKMGKIVVPIEFEKSPEALNNDLFKVYKNGKYGIIKRDGKMLFDYKYDEIYQCGQSSSSKPSEAEKIIRVKNGGMYGYIKTDGTVFKDCIYDEAGDFFGNLASITKTEDGIQKKGNLIIQAYDGKGKLLAPGQEALEEPLVEKPTESSYSSGSKSGGKSNPNDGWLVIKNVGKKRLYVMTGSGSSSHISPGSTSKWPCNTDIYYCYLDSKGTTYNVKGPLIAKGKSNCGSVVEASGN